VIAMILAMMYLVTSSTALAHGLSHPPAHDAGRADACSEISDDHGDHAGAQGCFFCNHGPAVAIVAIAPLCAVPAAAYQVLVTAPVQEHPAARAGYSPPLRAPPVHSLR
jgi:hypothetical protein